MEMEEEMEEDSYSQAPLERNQRDRQEERNGQILQVMEEEEKTSLFLPPQYKNHNK